MTKGRNCTVKRQHFTVLSSLLDILRFLFSDSIMRYYPHRL
jgi:hypothetical protein